MTVTNGVGISYRPEFETLMGHLAGHIDCVELLMDDYTQKDDPTDGIVPALSLGLPLLAHATNLSLGSADWHPDRCGGLKESLSLLGISLLSEHASFSTVAEFSLPNFIPIEFSEAGIDLLSRNVRCAHACLQAEISVENIVYFFVQPGSAMGEASFYRRITQADCRLLLDVNNLFVNSINHRYDPFAFIDELDGDRVSYLHVAGHSTVDGLLVDSHEEDVDSRVWALAEYALRRTSAQAMILERDNQSASLQTLIGELDKAREVWTRVRG